MKLWWAFKRLRSFQSHTEVRHVYLSTVPMLSVFQLPCCKVSYALNLKVAETGTPTAQPMVRGHTGKRHRTRQRQSTHQEAIQWQRTRVTVSAKMSQRCRPGVEGAPHDFARCYGTPKVVKVSPAKPLRALYCDIPHGQSAGNLNV